MMMTYAEKEKQRRFVIYRNDGTVICETTCPGHMEYVTGLYHQDNPWVKSLTANQKTLKGKDLAKSITGYANKETLERMVKRLDGKSWHLDNYSLAQLSAAKYLLAQ
jgi:hypothetical protein